MSTPVEEDTYAALIARASGGDRRALRRLYDATAHRLFALALRLTNRRITAEQVLLDVFLSIWQHQIDFDPDRVSGWGWLVATTRARALVVLERDGRDNMPGASFAATYALQDPAVFDRLADTPEGRQLQTCLEELPELHRRVILSAYLDGAPHEEVAEALSAPPGAVKDWIRQGLIHLKECLG